MSRIRRAAWTLGVVGLIAALAPGSALGGTQVFSAVADSYVSAAKPGVNYGGQSRLKVDSGPVVNAYLRFDVRLPVGAVVSAASLELYAASGYSAQGVSVAGVADSPWGEYSLTFQNAPSLGAELGRSGPWGSSGYQAVALAAGALRDGLSSFAVTSANAKAISFLSRESGSPPRLRVSYSVAPAPPANLSVTDTSATSISVSWSASADPGVSGYDVYRDGTAVATTSATAYTLTGLSCGTSYTIAVDAFTTTGERSSPAALTASTSQCPPPGAAPLVPASGAYFGVWVEDPVVGWWTQQGLLDFEAMIGRKVAIDHHYYRWDETFPGAAERWDLQNGRIPMISMGGASVFPGLDAINNGSQDARLQAIAQRFANLGGKVFFRPWWEMNGNWYPWDGTHNNDPGTTNGSAKFVQAWRRMHDIFVRAGATNVVWVWAPDAGDVPPIPWNHWTNYYPGDAYVDWVGVDGYNWGTWKPWSRWTSFVSIFGGSPSVYADYSASKPLMVSETSSCEQGGDKSQWIAAAATAMKSELPAIRALVWFDSTVECDWRVNTSQSPLDAYRAVAADPYFSPGN